MARFADADITLAKALERSEFYRQRYGELLATVVAHGYECHENAHPGRPCPIDQHLAEAPDCVCEMPS